MGLNWVLLRKFFNVNYLSVCVVCEGNWVSYVLYGIFEGRGLRFMRGKWYF